MSQKWGGDDESVTGQIWNWFFPNPDDPNVQSRNSMAEARSGNSNRVLTQQQRTLVDLSVKKTSVPENPKVAFENLVGAAKSGTSNGIRTQDEQKLVDLAVKKKTAVLLEIDWDAIQSRNVSKQNSMKVSERPSVVIDKWFDMSWGMKKISMYKNSEHAGVAREIEQYVYVKELYRELWEENNIETVREYELKRQGIYDAGKGIWDSKHSKEATGYWQFNGERPNLPRLDSRLDHLPLIGPVREVVYRLDNGQLELAVVYSVLAVDDAFMVYGLAKGALKLGARSLTINSTRAETRAVTSALGGISGITQLGAPGANIASASSFAGRQLNRCLRQQKWLLYSAIQDLSMR